MLDKLKWLHVVQNGKLIKVISYANKFYLPVTAEWLNESWNELICLYFYTEHEINFSKPMFLHNVWANSDGSFRLTLKDTRSRHKIVVEFPYIDERRLLRQHFV